MDQYRMLILLNTWQGTQYVHQSLFARKVGSLARKLDNNGSLSKALTHKALDISQKVLKSMIADAEKDGKNTQHLVEAIHKVPKDYHNLDRFQALCVMLQGAPKLREWLCRVRYEVFHLQEKSIARCSNPGQQLIAAALLNLAGIPCAVYHSDLTGHQRTKLLTEFNTNPATPMVMVCSYFVNSAGSNMQHLCRNIYLLCTPMGLAITAQAVGRVRRLGQSYVVKVYEYHLMKSFDMDLIANNISKAIPSVALAMDQTSWNFTLNNSADGSVDMPPFTRNSDGTISAIPDVWMPYIDVNHICEPQRFIKSIINAQAQSRAFLRPAEDIPDVIENILASVKEYPTGCETPSNIYRLPIESLKAFLKEKLTPYSNSLLAEEQTRFTLDEI